MQTQTIHQETVVLPASWFQKLEFTHIEGLDVIVGHWETEYGADVYPMQQIICTLYHETIVHPSPNIQQVEDNGGLTIFSPDGFYQVEVWE